MHFSTIVRRTHALVASVKKGHSTHGKNSRICGDRKRNGMRVNGTSGIESRGKIGQDVKVANAFPILSAQSNRRKSVAANGTETRAG